MKTILFSTLLFFTLSTFAQLHTRGDDFTDTRDGKIYKTIEIGSQCWFAENLNYGIFTETTQLGVPHSNMHDDGIAEKYCYDNDEANCNIYGGLYEWNELMKYTEIEKVQGLCPNGWHIPSDAEWKILEVELGMSQAEADAVGDRGTDEGTKLKDGGTSGFDALLAGYRFGYGSTNSFGTLGYFWTSTESDIADKFYYRSLTTGAKITRATEQTIHGSSVRCILGEGLFVNDIGDNSFFLSKPFPNPVKMSTQIKYNLPPNVSSGYFILYNILGNEVKRIKVDRSHQPIVINASDFKNGTYFYQLSYNGTSSGTKKLIISK